MVTSSMAADFEKHVREYNEFMDSLSMKLGYDKNLTYKIIKSVLITLREIAAMEESLYILNFSPVILKIMYLENWKAGNGRIKKVKNILTFIDIIKKNYKKAFNCFPQTVQWEFAARVIFRSIYNFSSAKENNSNEILPASITRLFNNEIITV